MPPPRVSPPTPVGGDDAAGGGQTVPGGRVVEAAPGGAAGSSAESLVRVHRDRPHARQVGNHRAVGGAEAGHAVPAAADRQLGAGLTGVPHHRGDVLGRSAADHRLRPCLDHGVVDPAGLVVAAVRSDDDRTAHPPPQGFQCLRRHDASSVLGRLRFADRDAEAATTVETSTRRRMTRSARLLPSLRMVRFRHRRRRCLGLASGRARLDTSTAARPLGESRAARLRRSTAGAGHAGGGMVGSHPRCSPAGVHRRRTGRGQVAPARGGGDRAAPARCHGAARDVRCGLRSAVPAVRRTHRGTAARACTRAVDHPWNCRAGCRRYRPEEARRPPENPGGST